MNPSLETTVAALLAAAQLAVGPQEFAALCAAYATRRQALDRLYGLDAGAELAPWTPAELARRDG